MSPQHSILRLCFAVTVSALGVLQAARLSAGVDYIWLEGEKPSEVSHAQKQEGVGRPEFLSGRAWLKIAIDAANVDKEVPDNGVRIDYTFNVTRPDAYEVWNRIGYEFVRSPFEWRIDNGAWQRIEPDQLTTDLMELSWWTEVAWLKMGQAELAAGPHRLSIRLPKTKDAKGKRARILYASDALCLSASPFHPYSHYKPDEDHRTPQDREAAAHVFRMPGPDVAQTPARVRLPLAGRWEVCRYDEALPGEVAAPIQTFPEAPRWTAINVPGDKNDRPDLIFAHRLWYRTRVYVPEALAGRAFFMVFPQNNLNTTVYVNGVYCGFDKNPFARVQIDVTRGIRVGATNEIWVGIRDAWYGYSTSPSDPMKLRRKFNLPRRFFSEGFQDLAYPIWNHPQSGILATPELVAAGSVYAADVFCRPSVQRRELTVEITLKNPMAHAASCQLQYEAVHVQSRRVEKRFAPQRFELPAQSERVLTLTESWADPKLWWPDEPNLYALRVTVDAGSPNGGALVSDRSETRFGFREWGIAGTQFTLNGVPFHGWADCFTAPNPEAWLKFYRDTHQTVMRFWGTRWMGLTPEEALNFFDENGVVVRRSGLLDGERIGYMAIEQDPELRKLYGSEIKMQLMRNWRDQIVAQVKGERNHPSIMIWSIENEWLYINCINLYRNRLPQFEQAVVEVSDAVRAVDPTRPTMTDGGGATRSQRMPVHGDHYVWLRDNLGVYPDHAYTAQPEGGGRGYWTWDQQRPRFIGEDYYIAGHHPELAYVGGEAVFAGKAASLPAAGLMARILTEGYRWAGFGAFHFWMNQHDTDGSHYRSFAPRAAFVREWDWTFPAGRPVKRTLRIFNDTRWEDPVTLAWTLTMNGRQVAGDSIEYRVAPGGAETVELTLPIPEVTERTEAEFAWTLNAAGAEVFRDARDVSVLPEPQPNAFVGADSAIGVWDPDGTLSAWLTNQGIPFARVNDPVSWPGKTRVLLVGRNALDTTSSASSALAALAARGLRVIVLEQKHPLRYQALPCRMQPAENEGRVAFAEDLEHPALRGLQQKDFFTWQADGVVYRDAYLKPESGARSLVQCGESLKYCALAEVPVGTGLMLLSQLVLVEKLDQSIVARRLLANLIAYAEAYEFETRPVVSVSDDALLLRELDAMGLQYRALGSPAEAVLPPGERVAVISATPANLHWLAAHRTEVEQFTAAGGWIVFHGLTPDGLQDFNALVGVEHLIRPFRRERVTLAPHRSRLAAGITSADVALYSAERIFPWRAGNYVADDTFSYVVDYDEVAPFARFPNDYFLTMVNGMVSADAWKYIFSFNLAEGDQPEWDMIFPREEEFIELTWIGNGFYHFVTGLEITFDGKNTLRLRTEPNTEPQTFPIEPPRRGRRLHWKITDWQVTPGKRDVVGVDNIYLKVKRSPAFYERVKPMLNIGALVEYPRGKGGFVLCNVRFKQTEEVPANAIHKRAILATILRNLKAPFAGRTIIAGADLEYEPIDLSPYANAYLDERGWFGDKRFTFKDLPKGRQRLAGVLYHIYDFPTSPVPTVLMLSERAARPATEIRGIRVGTRADALFFLHTMKLERRMNPRERRQGKKFETLRYVVHYADGRTAEIPVYAEIDIADYRSKEPQAIPGAQLAWVKRYPDSDWHAIAYSMQWTNPRPEVQIASVDMLPGNAPRGVPVLIALTAAKAR